MRREDIKEAAINYDSRLVAFRAFMKGAEWRINSVWHDANEQPDRGKDIIVMYSNKSCRVFLPNGIWDNLIKWINLSNGHTSKIYYLIRRIEK